jgi:prepilin-type N-terminal cleavage/methylation domain-containing protein
MKKSLSRSRLSRFSGFTLVELLVVIAIIAILAAILLGVAGPAIRSAQRAKAANLANQIQTAASAYDTEYGVYPVPTGTTGDYTIADLSGNAGTWGTLIDVLCGNVSPSTGIAVPAGTIANTRGIAFLTLRTTDVDKSDAPLNSLPTGPEIYFNIAMDSDYDGILGTGTSAAQLPNFAAGTPTSLTLSGGSSTAGVAVWANCNGSTTSKNANFWVHTY